MAVTYSGNTSNTTIRVGTSFTTNGITDTYSNYRGYLKATANGNGIYKSPTSDGVIFSTETVPAGDPPTPTTP